MSEIRADKIHNVTGDNDSGIDLSTNDQVDIKIANSVKARVDSSGNLLVGTTDANPATNNVNGFATVGNITEMSRSSGEVLRINRGNDGALVNFKSAGSTVGNLGTKSSYIYIGTPNNSHLAFASDSIYPANNNGAFRDNAIDLGDASSRFDDIRATNGTIQTSDRNEKQDIEELSDAEKTVAVVAKGLMRKFRWRDAVAEKGDNARTHFGIIAQDLQDAFTAEGLDASKYAMFCSDTWTDDDGKEQIRLGVRYSELLAFIISAL
tara:strand:+ start:711 stop:1505 length:795 start_codon:yes stop_codon:yes gene_type:complete